MISFFDHILPALLFPSLLAALGASIAGGVVGTYIVVKRIVSISGSISHSILGGIGLTLWIQYRLNLEFSPMYGAIVGAIILAICIGKIHLKYQEREDALIAMIWSVGMAIGIIFISQLPAFNSELVNFLFGNILWVTTHDLYSLGILDVVVLTTVALCHTRFLALCFDEKYMMLSRYSVQTWYFLLLILTAITIVMLIYIMGVILMLSMLVLPISIACRFSYRMVNIMIVSVLLNILCSFFGIALAYALDFPAGPTIAILMGIAYTLSLFVKRLFSRSTPSPVSPDNITNFSKGKSL
ncbi:Manganese transport system membrane protein mntB,high-affinity zinc transporter membrane component,anchored repeat-type ABC transporter, permease subunit,ABC 3 transport family [Chlamydia poikilotherma]|uniref:Manganese transport system membrane protein mntB,high-affinity zinc transporter membrane component,anchored repeat-type ABC transporter, permease subunit,ABC 3 transport family n=1 Tax=Chlamydia poikilotherma TaxID=1967783 RepID=A0A3B0PRQ5_9CHLA|nr:metal ABC transporter permease [Chlamydia poikilotherma]SYX08691.1 Manganese transport system membrane protein mntB,high-affinity zinc transporter membrane component,anchored repeat-type ABC transporter, permease subunit,ABC 3 transport family [Chlamydia poikilotherma]